MLNEISNDAGYCLCILRLHREGFMFIKVIEISKIRLNTFTITTDIVHNGFPSRNVGSYS